MSQTRPRPRVLVADDHQEMLTIASAMLRETCDVVASVSDGLQAVEQASRLNPDVVVLDITMPILDGYQAARELRRRGSQAKVLFLSLHEGTEFVAAAFEAGGQGFVPKQRMSTDLASAVEHVHAGRAFLPSMASFSAVAPRGGHGVMFYSRHAAWCREAAALVGVALSHGDVVAVFAQEVTRTGIAKKLAARGVDTARAEADGRYSVLDAADTLQQFMVDGRPDPRRVAAVVADLEETRLAVSSSDTRLTIIGEVAPGLPCERRDDILGIERLWNELAGERRFLTVCGYSMDLVRDDAENRPWPEVCAEHWAVTQSLDE